MAKLVVVSNRVALPDARPASRAGGLEVAIRESLKRAPSGLWFGWSGRIAANEQDAGAEDRDIAGVRYRVIDLVRSDFDEYYNGFANRVLWPILHYRLDLAEFTYRDLSGYLRVNEKFADEIVQLLDHDDYIWVHDYHLLPLAQSLRSRGCRQRIGLFLHTPFPPPEILTGLPNHEHIVRAMLSYDLIGFQTGDDAYNFSRYLAREMGLPIHDFTFMTDERRVVVAAFPVGIETERFGRLARRARNASVVRNLFTGLGDRKLVIGVDRLDYSKGLPYRLQAFERLLSNDPAWREKVTYMQITPTSRPEIRQYVDIGQEVGMLVARINGAFGELDWTPVRYLNRAFSRTTLSGIYRGARAALVTPLRDGMNLVAKEYIAAQDPEDPGVLVLSQFAGAARECKAALIVNPFDIEAVAQALAQALSMPLDERQYRHRLLIEAIRKNDISHWSDRFLEQLRREAPVQEPLSGRSMPRIVEQQAIPRIRG